MNRRRVASVAFAAMVCGCSPDSSSAAYTPLNLTVAEETVSPGASVRVTVTNESATPVSVYVSGCRYHVLTYQASVGSTWVDRVTPDTLGCQPAGATMPFARGESQQYLWTAPADTGTYRVTMSLAGYAFVSPPIVVR